MKTIQLHKGSIELPDNWEDLSYKEKIFTFGILSELFAGVLTPEVARLKMLIEYTGYKPSVVQLIREALSKSDQREVIHFNLLKLSEQLHFAFSVEGNKIVPNYVFRTNPIPVLKLNRKIYPGRRFELDITARTNITAREFADCFDLLSAQQHLTSDADRAECISQICAILYPKTENYKENMVSGHDKQMRSVFPAAKFGIIFWFTGIARFYTGHPVYGLLFKNNKKEAGTDKISLGMNEITLTLKKEGYGDPETMSVNDWFDSQVKYLKDMIHKSIAAGVKVTELSQKSGIPIDVIHKLS
ncbi:MAG: hypothetical protein LBG15_07935 [Dysgonamonadaceae bacterium]|jgi:hypothetical protein|nr:hypothetical protein [Dysgonamonadaceae bacterium]